MENKNNKNWPEWSLGDLLVWAGGKKERIGTVVGLSLIHI